MILYYVRETARLKQSVSISCILEYKVGMLFRYSIQNLLFSRCRGPCHNFSEALLAKITEALLANYRMRFKSQSATAFNY